MRQEKGVITVFLALIFGLLFTFFCFTIDITRINSAKNQLIVASDAAISSVLTKFNQDLYKSYGIMSFKDNGDVTDKVTNIMKLNLPNEENSNLFKIDVDDITTTVGGNPFTENDVMKKQMIYSMKYQGTENLVLEVFDEIKQILKVKDILKKTEELKKIDKELEKGLAKEFKDLYEGQKVALRTTIELAKNNTNLQVYGKVMDNQSSISESKLSDRYENSKFNIKIPLDSKVYQYEANTVIHQAYSYAYTEMILNMCKQYALEQESEEVQSTPENSDSNGSNNTESEEVKIKASENIDKLIKKLKTTTGKNKGITKGISAFKGRLNKEKINNAISIATNINNNKASYIELLKKYDPIINHKDSELSTTAESNKNYYMDMLNKLPNIKKDLENINQEVTRVATELDTLSEKLNNMISNSPKATPNLYNAVKNAINFENDITNIKEATIIDKIATSSAILDACGLNNIIKNNQINTTKDLKITEAIKLDPSNEKYRDFYDKFKEKDKEDKEVPSLSEVMDNYDSTKYMEISNLPNKGKGKNVFGDLMDQLNNMPDLNNIADLSSLITGSSIADKIYLIEYIMTNFKDMVQPQDGKRIPEKTSNNTVLDYEIETIISGKFNDKLSKGTMKDDIWGIRFALNTVSLMAYQEQIMTFIDKVSTFISLTSRGFIPKPIAKYTMVAAWASMESNNDVIDIMNGYNVPLVKVEFGQWTTNFDLDATDFNRFDENNSNALDTVESNLNLYDGDSKSSDGAHNEQDYKYKGDNVLGMIKLNYTDMLRFKLLITNETTLINRVQDLISGNLIKDYNNYNTDIEVNVNQSSVNMLFNTEYFSPDGGRNKFNQFSFKRAYN